MVNTNYELVILRNDFYYRYIKLLRSINIFGLVLFAALLGFYIYVAHTENPPPIYVPTTPDGRVIYSPAIDFNHLDLQIQQKYVDPKTDLIYGMPQPKKTFTELAKLGNDALVIHWASNAILKLFDYDYIHYRQSIQNMRPYFNQNAYTKFIEAMYESRAIEPVKARSAILVPKLIKEPVIKKTSMMFGHLVWEIVAVIELNYQSAGFPDLIETLEVNALIARYPTYVAPFYGLLFVKTNFKQVDQ